MTTDWDRIERLLGQGSMALLRQKTVGVIGLGSGGGYVALSLAMTGVQRFILLADDVLDAHNIVRHVADYRDIGRPKVEAVADLIKHRNPNAQVEAICDRFENRDDVLERVDLVVVGVDNE